MAMMREVFQLPTTEASDFDTNSPAAKVNAQNIIHCNTHNKNCNKNAHAHVYTVKKHYLIKRNNSFIKNVASLLKTNTQVFNLSP